MVDILRNIKYKHHISFSSFIGKSLKPGIESMYNPFSSQMYRVAYTYMQEKNLNKPLKIYRNQNHEDMIYIKEKNNTTLK